MDFEDLKVLLDQDVILYQLPSFIEDDPIQVPHRFTKKQDIEIAGFMASIFAWGQRKTIINKANEFVGMMDDAPHDFIMNHAPKDLKVFEGFKHRTFNGIDALYFIEFFKMHYQNNDSLESAFTQFMSKDDETVELALRGFKDYFFSIEDSPQRTRKHIASPNTNSTCKRLNMFLRWMVRSNDTGVDFGIWKNIKPSQLLIPLDVHVDRVARNYGLIQRKQTDFKTVLELSARLNEFDAEDPSKYDFALFGKGVIEKK